MALSDDLRERVIGAVVHSNGKKLKSLKRHLAALGLTPEQYRERWSLPADYPMVAANYSAQRWVLAKEIGLGQLHRKDAPRGRRPKAAKA